MVTTEFRLHLWSGVPGKQVPTTRLEADPDRHGAALALREFTRGGCDVTSPGAHIDMEHAGGRTHTVLVTEVLDWLRLPAQSEFVARENLAALLEIQV
jgi:hypothetical protein